VTAVWQVLVTLFIWLLAFSVYIVPVGIAVWVVRKRLWRRLPRVLPARGRRADIASEAEQSGGWRNQPPLCSA
jgi:hypothetical protein